MYTTPFSSTTCGTVVVAVACGVTVTTVVPSYDVVSSSAACTFDSNALKVIRSNELVFVETIFIFFS